MSDSSYPTKILKIPDGLCEELSETFQKKGWTYWEEETVTPKMIENNINQLLLILLEDPDENTPVSSGRILLSRNRWGDTLSVDICLEVGEIEGIPYNSSPTKMIGEEKDE